MKVVEPVMCLGMIDNDFRRCGRRRAVNMDRDVRHRAFGHRLMQSRDQLRCRYRGEHATAWRATIPADQWQM